MVKIFILCLFITYNISNTIVDFSKITYPKKVTQDTTDIKLIKAMCIVESGGDPLAYRESEKAAGILQIRPVMVNEVNRIVGKKKFTLNDRWSVSKSIQMFRIYSKFYNKYHNEVSYIYENVSRRWNGGPTGHSKKSTKKYWHEVKQLL